MTTEFTREELIEAAELQVNLNKGTDMEEGWQYQFAQALLKSYKQEDNHECLCKGCGNRLLIADAAPSWDALSPEQHREINTIVARLAEPYLKREEALKKAIREYGPLNHRYPPPLWKELKPGECLKGRTEIACRCGLDALLQGKESNG